MKCEICKTRMAHQRCRRCGRAICTKCHFHHGLCTECRGRLRGQ
ncbi:hypothetical protein GACE_0146 [Geoglobus acetivorans]|uniref:B box-type domain-containing protein n=1 Tax=Geoglobus acetivorans TaxID=565033 RepID=A0A0A7GBH1_GEOAI|nr:hypothetical protein GACE_0146 [Geoglobus acetivorans]